MTLELCNEIDSTTKEVRKMKQAKLKTLLYDHKITQKQIARHLGVTEHTLSDKMRGVREFTYSEVYHICRLLGIENPMDVFEAK